MATPARRPDDDDASADHAGAVDDLVAILRTAGAGARTLGGAGLSAVADGSEAAIAAFVAARVRRVHDRAEARGHVTPPALTDALTAPRTSGVAKRLGTSGAARLAKRAGPIARRSPTAIALRVGPAFYDVGASVVREIDAVAAQLVAKAASEKRDPDPELIHTVTVQLLAGRPVDPTVHPPHAALVRAWLRRLGGQLAPFGLGGGGTDITALAAALDDVDPRDLGPKRPRRSS